MSSCGNITISGGTVTATGGDSAAGIGSGSNNSSCGNITISGGTVTANGGSEAAGIGSGCYYSSCGTVTISGGTVNATGGHEGAGIGSGWYYSSCGTVTISGGTVNANNGGDRGAGIGSGSNNSSCGNITISGGTVTATGSDYAAGIGSGYWYSSCGNIIISGGTVTADGGYGGAGIGSGYNNSSCDDITISGGIVTATGGDSAAGIGSGTYSTCGTVTITNGVTMVIATKGYSSPNTIGAGLQGSCGTVTIGGVTGFITESPYAYIPNLVTLTPQSEEVTLQNGTVLNGTGGENTRVKIADGATVVLYGVNITAIPEDNDHQWAGITCLGDAVIVLYQGTTNDVKGGGYNPGIFVPQGHTLTLQGGGTLNATGGFAGAGIGSGYGSSCGNIILSGGTVNATGGFEAAGIGSSADNSSCGTVTISGGTVTANGGWGGAGIGSGYNNSSCGTVTICGGTVTANGGQYAAGIGSSANNSSCESITITNGVTIVIATKIYSSANAIGAGNTGSCGTVTIGGIETGFITESPFTTYPYTVGFDANGGSGTMANQGFMYGVAQNLTASSLTNWGHSLEGWATSANGPKVYDDGQSVSNLTETPGATVTLYAKWNMHISVDGDEYTIHTTTGWDMFCDLLANNSNGYFTGKTVKLDADISVTRMAGGSDHEFSGTFDGQGHTLTVSYTTTEQYTAPFRYVNGATITNLVTAGTISTSKKFASGMIGGTLGGVVSITNCKVDVTINSSINGDGTYGGFVALASYGTLNITGCTFSGEMLGENTINCGGFVGWTESNNNATTTITDCLFAPTTLEISSGRTFSRARNMSSVTITNSYYTEPLGTAQGYPAVSNPAIQPAGDPTATYNVSGITAYTNGMLYGETFYYNPDMNFVLDIEGYGDVSNPGGYYLIASPVVEAIVPSADNGFITNAYDLYYFDQTYVGEEWQNYKTSDFLLTNGTGYLYATEIATTLTFTGTPYTGDGEIALAYNPNVPDLAGWNLVGNPFAETAYVDRDFYTMNSDGSEIIASTSSTVEAMEGIFVVADYNGETVTFAPATREAHPEERIVLNLTRSNSTVIDRAIVRFGEGKPLPKFQLDPSHTKVYIPMDGKDYAVVRSESMGEMPVNFKAEHNGTYTLTFSTENLDLGYLHLIDNLTGADVDLLVPEPVEGPASYTFTAKTTDYESRFKLVFSTNEDGPSTGSGAFAFINNGNIIVNGEGMLQVIDMMGRVVYQGNAMNRVSTGGMTPGAYILRLIDGDNVRTQKIVIE